MIYLVIHVIIMKLRLHHEYTLDKASKHICVEIKSFISVWNSWWPTQSIMCHTLSSCPRASQVTWYFYLSFLFREMQFQWTNTAAGQTVYTDWWVQTLPFPLSSSTLRSLTKYIHIDLFNLYPGFLHHVSFEQNPFPSMSPISQQQHPFHQANGHRELR